MHTILFSEGAAPRPRTSRPVSDRRYQGLSLPEIVRDLAGWTPPAQQPEAGRQPASWRLA